MLRELANDVQPLLRARGARLELALQIVVERRDAHHHRDEIFVCEALEQIEIAKDQSAFRDQRERVPVLEQHLEETRGHVTRLEKVFEAIGEEPHAEECVGFEGLKQEHSELSEKASSSLIDLVDLGAAARTENYEIAAYEGLRRMAKGLGEDKAVELLDQSLAEEKEALRLVEKIATRVSNESVSQAATSSVS